MGWRGFCLRKPLAPVLPASEMSLAPGKSPSLRSSRAGSREQLRVSQLKGVPGCLAAEEDTLGYRGPDGEAMDDSSGAQWHFHFPLPLCRSSLSSQTCRRSPCPHEVHNCLSRRPEHRSQLLRPPHPSISPLGSPQNSHRKR